MTYLGARILDDRVGVGELLYAARLGLQLAVDEAAWLVEDVRPAGVLEEALRVLPVPVELDVHVLPVTAALRLDHLLYRRATVDRQALLAALLPDQQLHLRIGHAPRRRLQIRH